VLTVTTPVDEVLDAITRALRPLRRLGVDPEKVALAFSLVLRAIPTTVAIADETRDAARARGLERDPRARLTPLVLRVVAQARATGEALHARGLGDD
jgi:biotin transport system permease protein